MDPESKTGRPKGSAKLTPDAYRRLERDALDGTVTLRELAARFGISVSTVSDVKAKARARAEGTALVEHG